MSYVRSHGGSLLLARIKGRTPRRSTISYTDIPFYWPCGLPIHLFAWFVWCKSGTFPTLEPYRRSVRLSSVNQSLQRSSQFELLTSWLPIIAILQTVCWCRERITDPNRQAHQAPKRNINCLLSIQGKTPSPWPRLTMPGRPEARTRLPTHYQPIPRSRT